jgi:hypothetical protein
MFSNTQTLQNNRPQDVFLRNSPNNQPRMLTSSGGFTTPTTPPVLSISNEKTLSQRSLNNNHFLPPDEDLLLQSSNGLDIPVNSSSSSSSAPSPQQHSPAVVRTAPFYVSVYTSTPPIPLVKGTVASSAPPTNDDELYFTRRSPSPKTSSILKKPEQSNVYKYHPSTSIQQQK